MSEERIVSWQEKMARGNALSDDAMDIAEAGDLPRATKLMRAANALRTVALEEKWGEKKQDRP